MARELALTCSCLVRCEHGLTELLPGSIKALEGLVGDLKPTHDLPNFCLVATLKTYPCKSMLLLHLRQAVEETA